MPDGVACIDCFDLAGGSALIAETVERCLIFPELREQLGATSSLPRRVD
jgi:hypothetical protein